MQLVSVLQSSWKALLAFLFAAYVASVYIARYTKARRIAKLGGQAPRVPTSFIFGRWQS
jgi:hypothetical protein